MNNNSSQLDTKLTNRISVKMLRDNCKTHKPFNVISNNDLNFWNS